MAIRVPEWLKRFRKRPVDPFTKAAGDGLDLLRPPSYDMTDALRDELRAEVDELMGRLLPGAVDAYSGTVLDGWIDARAAQIVARLDADREESQAVAEAVIGLAREEVAKRKSRYDADLDRLKWAREALAVTRQQLLGGCEIPATEADDRPLGSTLGRVTVSDLMPVDDAPRPDDTSNRPRSGSDGAEAPTDVIGENTEPFVPPQDRLQERNGHGTADQAAGPSS